MFDTIYSGTVAKDPFGSTRAVVLISDNVDGSAWELTWNGKLATGDEVALSCNVEWLKQPEIDL